MRGRPDAATDVRRRSLRRRQLMQPHLHWLRRTNTAKGRRTLYVNLHFGLAQSFPTATLISGERL